MPGLSMCNLVTMTSRLQADTQSLPYLSTTLWYSCRRLSISQSCRHTRGQQLMLGAGEMGVGHALGTPTLTSCSQLSNSSMHLAHDLH